MERRTVLAAAGTALSAPLVGCLEAGGGFGDGDDDGTGADGDGGNGDDGDDDTGGDGDVSYDVFQLGEVTVGPVWHERSDRPPGFVTTVTSERDPLWMIDTPENAEGLEEWLDGTDFEESVVVFVETVGPTTCYSEIDVSDVGIEDGTVVARAAAVDTSEEAGGCGDAVTYPSALIRVRADDPPTEAALSVTNGWGESATVESGRGVLEPADLPGAVEPAGDPPAVPPELACDDEAFRRLSTPAEDVVWGELADEDGEPALAMRVLEPGAPGDEASTLEFRRGDAVRIEMRNVSDRPLSTGNRNKFSLEVETEAGWMDVRGAPEDVPISYTDEAYSHPPGRGFEWTFELTEGGVLEGHAHEDRLEVCPDLREGRYRFVFWGAIGDEAPAVAFDYVG